VVTRESSAPLIAGAGVVQQRVDDPRQAMDALALMRTAIESAAQDAGAPSLLTDASIMLMPQGLWRCADPAPVVAPWKPGIAVTVAEIGVLQQTLLSRACTLVGSGAADVVIVCGAEAKHRDRRAQIAGVALPPLAGPSSGRDVERLVPAAEIITREEIERGLPVPARQYAMIDTARRRAEGLSPGEHVALLARLQASFSAVAASNPDAWERREVSTDEVVASPMLAWPYTKLHCSQWNVDQATALIVCSAHAARSHGIAPDRCVFAHVGVESNLMVPLTQRAAIDRSPAVAAVGDAIRDHTGVAPGDHEHLDLYSCFPAAVRVQLHEMAIDPGRPLTVTGGMTFAGGPLNNYTLQATAKLVHVLREDPTTRGMVTNVSGMLTKFGAATWSATPPPSPFAALDVTAAATAGTATVDVDADYSGPAEVVTYTVAHDRGEPTLGIVVADTPQGTRAVATTTDIAVMASMERDEWCARPVDVDGPALLT
jgi:acetyl-CoA C-acetyltransferase